MIVQDTIYTANRRFDSAWEFVTYAWAGHEKLISGTSKKVSEMIEDGKLLFTVTLLAQGGARVEMTRLWLDQAALDEYNTFQRKTAHMESVRRDLKDRGIRVQERFETA